MSELKSQYHKSYFALILFSLILFSCKQKTKVDLILHHAIIYTVDSSFSTVEAMAVKNGKIIAVGKNESILNLYQSDSMIDAQAKAVFPAFIDAHCHFTGYATDLWKCDLVGTQSFDEVVQKIKAYSKHAPMEWIYGHG